MPKNGEAMVVLFAVLMTIHVLIFSISIAIAMWYYGFSAETGILLLFVAAAAAASTSSLAVRREVHLMFLICTMTPPTIVIFFFWEVEQLALSLACVLYVLFLVRAGSAANRSFKEMAITQLALGASNNELQELNIELKQVIDDRTGTENKLQGVRGRYIRSLEESLDPVIVTRDWKIIYANEAAADFLGRDVNALLNTAADKLIHPDYQDVVNEVWQVTEPGNLPLLEIGFLKPDGSMIYGEARWSSTSFGDRAATLIIIRDQTLRRESERALRKSEEEFRNLIELSPDPVIVHLNERIIYANQALQALSGYSKAELETSRIVDFLHPDDLRIYAKRQVQLQNGEKTTPQEIRFFKRDGEIIFVEVNSFSSSFAGQENARIVMIRDLTARRAAEELIRDRENKLRQSQKLEAMGTLAGGIAHDCNNMLSSIIGYSELAMNEVDEKSSIYSNLNSVLLASQRATDLVRQILTFSRRDHEIKVPIELETCIRSALVLLKQSIPTSIELRSHFNTRSSTVLADQT